MKWRMSVLAVVVALGVPLSAWAQRPETAVREREEYAVYSAIAPEIYHQDEGGIFVIANPARGYAHQLAKKDLRFRYAAPLLSEETFDDFVERNKGDRWLERKFQLDFAYIIADYREIGRLISPDPLNDWKDFFRQYHGSHGYSSYSRVGFNQTMDQALVYAGWSCPGLCGHWEFLLLAKKDGVWKVIDGANRIVS
jgi:hypothetical protein